MAIKNKAKKEKNELIFKYQKQDIIKKLGRILGDDFKQYRQDFDKTQNYLKTKFVPDFPLTISLELVNRCNLNCIMCYPEHHRKTKKELSVESLKKIFKECKKNKLPSIILGLGAETLVYGNIKLVLTMIKKAGIQDIFFGTNGVLLNLAVSELLVKNKITRVEISLDAVNSDTYKKIRGFDRLKIVEANINQFLALRKKHHSQLPIVRLCFVVMEENKKETRAFINKWKNKADYVDFQRCADLSSVKQLIKINPKEIVNSFCAYPFYSLNIWADGSVSPCCSFYGEYLKLGNIHQQTLKEIWQGEKIRKIRQEIAEKKFNPVCQNCFYFRDKDLIDSRFKKDSKIHEQKETPEREK